MLLIRLSIWIVVFATADAVAADRSNAVVADAADPELCRSFIEERIVRLVRIAIDRSTGTSAATDSYNRSLISLTRLLFSSVLQETAIS